MLAVAREEGHGVGRAVCAHAAQRGLCMPLDALEAHLEPVWAHTVPERSQAGGIQGREDRAYPQRPYALSTEMWALWLGKRAGPQARERETGAPASGFRCGLAPQPPVHWTVCNMDREPHRDQIEDGPRAALRRAAVSQSAI